VLAKGMPERFVVIDGTKSEDAIEKLIWTALEKRLFQPAAKPAKTRQTPPKLAKKKAPAKARSKKAGKR
jgi:dTMP kinase